MFAINNGLLRLSKENLYSSIEWSKPKISLHKISISRIFKWKLPCFTWICNQSIVFKHFETFLPILPVLLILVFTKIREEHLCNASVNQCNQTTDLISLHDKPVSIIVWHVALQHIWSDLTCSWIYYMIKPNTPGSWSIYGLHNRKQVQFWASQDHCFLCCAQCLKSPMSKIKTVKVLPSLWRNRGTL